MLEDSINDKLNAAVYTLVTSKGNIRDCIYRSYQQLGPLTMDDIPSNLQEKWMSFIDQLSMTQEGINIANIQNSLHKFQLEECVQIAEMINEMAAVMNVMDYEVNHTLYEHL